MVVKDNGTREEFSLVKLRKSIESVINDDTLTDEIIKRVLAFYNEYYEEDKQDIKTQELRDIIWFIIHSYDSRLANDYIEFKK